MTIQTNQTDQQKCGLNFVLLSKICASLLQMYFIENLNICLRCSNSIYYFCDRAKTWSDQIIGEKSMSVCVLPERLLFKL